MQWFQRHLVSPRSRPHTRNLSASGPASLSDGSLAGVLIAVLIVVVALCWVLPDEDPSQRLVQIIHARRVGRARAARADAKRWAAQPDNGHGFAAGTPEPRDWGTGDKGSYHLVSVTSMPAAPVPAGSTVALCSPPPAGEDHCVAVEVGDIDGPGSRVDRGIEGQLARGGGGQHVVGPPADHQQEAASNAQW